MIVLDPLKDPKNEPPKNEAIPTLGNLEAYLEVPLKLPFEGPLQKRLAGDLAAPPDAADVHSDFSAAGAAGLAGQVSVRQQ